MSPGHKCIRSQTHLFRTPVTREVPENGPCGPTEIAKHNPSHSQHTPRPVRSTATHGQSPFSAGRSTELHSEGKQLPFARRITTSSHAKVDFQTQPRKSSLDDQILTTSHDFPLRFKSLFRVSVSPSLPTPPVTFLTSTDRRANLFRKPSFDLFLVRFLRAAHQTSAPDSVRRLCFHKCPPPLPRFGGDRFLLMHQPNRDTHWHHPRLDPPQSTHNPKTPHGPQATLSPQALQSNHSLQAQHRPPPRSRDPR